MKALVYRGVQDFGVEDRPKPQVSAATDAVVKLAKTTICGTDLHILQGDVPTVAPGTILGHEGLGTVESVGTGVTAFKPGDRAEFVRIPHANSSLHAVPPGVDERALVMISDILPTALECGTLNGKVAPGATVAVIGAGPVGLSALMTAQLYSPSTLIMLDLDPARLAVAQRLGATHIVQSGPGKDPAAEVMRLTGGRGVDTAIEAVGVPATFGLCQDIIGVGGTIANVGVHGSKVDLHLEKLWDRNVAITTRLVDATTAPMLITLVESGRLDAQALTTHSFKFSEVENAYASFKAAAVNKALKVIIDFE
ncbi:theronine dehydrogenase [Amylocystis lapponica]|nr:theronine dehydrogenase [Amylocystis lapponica]